MTDLDLHKKEGSFLKELRIVADDHHATFSCLVVPYVHFHMLTKCGYVVVGTSRPRKSVIHMVDFFFFWLKSRVFTNFFQGVAQDDGRRCKK